MTAKELIELLETVDPETAIVVASDEEGNDFRLMSSHNTSDYVADLDEWSIDLVDKSELIERAEDGYDDSALKPVFVIWP